VLCGQSDALSSRAFREIPPLDLHIICCTIEAQCFGSWLGLRPHLSMKQNQRLNLAKVVQQIVDGSPRDDVAELKSESVTCWRCGRVSVQNVVRTRWLLVYLCVRIIN